MQYSASHRGFNRYHYYDKYIERHLKPWPYLDAIGIEKIVELLIDGYSLPWICNEIGLAQIIVLNWIDANPERDKRIEWARRNAADNWVYEGRDIMDGAHLDPTAVSKADKQANYRLKMAAGFNPDRWGKRVNVDARVTQATISYVINAPQQPIAKVIEGEAKPNRLISSETGNAVSEEEILDLTQLLMVGDEDEAEESQEDQNEEAA